MLVCSFIDAQQQTNHAVPEPRILSLSSVTETKLVYPTTVSREARRGLLSQPKTLAPWLFYDETGAGLFEQITILPEYYLTRAERALLQAHADEIVACASKGAALTIVELGAGTATKTGILLGAALRRQPRLLYQPIDVAQSSLDEAQTSLEARLPGLTVKPQLANYTAEQFWLHRKSDECILALYIGSSIGNFTPSEAIDVLTILRARLKPNDTLLLGTDLAPGPNKSLAALLAAYDDSKGITAAFNRNILARLNRDLGTDFDLACFAHKAVWNSVESRIEMHLVALAAQTVHVPADVESAPAILHFSQGETIHTENSYKFTPTAIANLLASAGYIPTETYTDKANLFAVTLATAV